jgi:signal transduction histidine kinase
MGRRTAVLLATTAVLLAAAAAGLASYLDRSARRAVAELLARRLEAVGTTAARLLASAPDLDRALADLVAANQLDGAYIVDEQYRVVADAQGHSGRRANLLRLDPDRAQKAAAGQASVGWAFDLAGSRFLGGYFRLRADGAARVLAVEAGEGFTAPSRRLEAAAVGAFAVGGALSLLALLALALAVRSAQREREAYGRAERAAMTSRMAAMVAHEVRNPLGIIRGAAELLRERATADDGELLDDVLGEVQRLNALTEEFLELGRDGPLALVPVEVAQVSRQVCEGVGLRYREKGLDIAASGVGTVLADANKLRQALLNLALNAAEATDGRGPVRIESAPLSDGVRLSVSDGGPGVPAELRPRLFEPFSTGKDNGTGLGLAIARKIFERHGGRLAYVPTKSGARFEAWLPAAPPNGAR